MGFNFPAKDVFYFRNCTFDDSRLPPMMPSGQYTAIILFFATSEGILDFAGSAGIDVIIKAKSYL